MFSPEGWGLDSEEIQFICIDTEVQKEDINTYQIILVVPTYEKSTFYNLKLSFRVKQKTLTYTVDRTKK